MPKEVRRGVGYRSERIRQSRVGSGYLYDNVVSELQKLTQRCLDIGRAQILEEKGESVKRTDLLEQNVYKKNVDWDYGWLKRYLWLVKRGENLAAIALQRQMDSHTVDAIAEIHFESIRFLHFFTQQTFVFALRGFR
ncbi:hypothetical protein OS493_016786 [Desmophyllum pertusum]|uniref:Uncharacterized protein n=1 Tax=Desmophyllum pertusum TaxID=174260 RepID=A0A9W9Z0M7_9CNID|nr:hypothetical protein OS493_016786 [Desmophyllum pertusum]